MADKISHAYGKNVHLLSDAFHQNLLTEFSQEAAAAPRIFDLARTLSRFLTIQAVNELFPRIEKTISTRMSKMHSEARIKTKIFDPQTKAIVVDLMRAGILPSQVAYETLLEILKPECVRQDHIMLNRSVDDDGQVKGTVMSGHKIGGDVADGFVVIADPMGATGSTITATIDLYERLAKEKLKGKKTLQFVALHFIITPEYLKRLKPYANRIQIFALRLDRGLSSKSVLDSMPGKHWNKERGLNDIDYIVPGAGGIGELLNNSLV